MTIARNADAVLVMIDLSHEPCAQLEMITEELEKAGLSVRRIESDVNISRTGSGSGIQVIISGHLLDGTAGSVRSILQEYGLTNISVTIRGRARLQDVEDAILESTMLYKPSVVIGNKIDLRDSRGYLEDLKEYSRNVPIIPVSCVTRQGLNDIGLTLFERLRIVRVYTKEPNEPEHSPDPFVLKDGSTVADLILRIHIGLAKDLRYAKIWGRVRHLMERKLGQPMFFSMEILSR